MAGGQAIRCLEIQVLLSANNFQGLKNKQIAKALRVTPCVVTNDINLMIEQGFVMRTPHDEKKYQLSTKIIKIAQAFQKNFDNNMLRFDEYKQRHNTEI